MTTDVQNSSEQSPRPRLFAQGYRACDVLLLALLFGAPALVYYSVENLNVSLNWFHGVALAVSAVALLGLFRVRIAFALLALPFFVWAAYSVVRGFFFPPEWVDLVNPIYAGKWAISIVIEYLIGAYFWKKFSGLEFLDWLSNLFERVR